MWRETKLRLKPRLHTLRPVPGAFAALAVTTAVVGLVLMASAAQALSRSGVRTNLTQASTSHPGYHRGVASWYYDKGHATACGFHAKFGVANKTLPCGTKVKFIYAGHRVTATVDDRGPYVAGRTWDLGQNARAALHFNGVHTVWAKW